MAAEDIYADVYYENDAPLAEGGNAGNSYSIAEDSFDGGYEAEYEEEFNTEEYSAQKEMGFAKASVTPLSTFSADVDTASYSNLRRMIDNGYGLEDIPAGAVRVEEILNYFDYDYRLPKDGEPFGVTTQIGDCPWQEGHKLLAIGLKSEEIDLAARRSDDGLGALLTPYYEEAQEYGKQKLGVLSGSWDWETDLSCVQSDTMNFIHEAQLWASGANVSISAPQTEGNFCIRQLLEDQWIAPMDRGSCYTIYPNENDRLVVVEMTGAELKDWLEQAAEGYTVEEDGSVTGGKGISQAYGVSYTVCLGNPEGKRVLNLTYQGRPLAADTVLRVAVSESSLAAAKADRSTYPIVWEAVITQGFRQAGGSVTWIIAEYIRSLTEGYRQITPPKPQSRWTVTTTPSGEVMVPVTRLEFVERLYDAVGRPSAYLDLKQTFSDIGGENPAAAWAVQAGIVQGNGKGQFNPDDRISREQAAIMLLRFDLARNMGPSGAWAVAVPYADATEISAWASEAVMWNVIRSYLPDDGNGNFRPQAALTTLELEGALERLGG